MTKRRSLAGVRGLLATMALLALPGSTAAQGASATQPPSSRWWAGGGGGYLASRGACTNCATDRPYGDGGAFLVQGGIRVKQRLSVGAEMFSATKHAAGSDVRNTYLLGIAQYRPFAARGFFIKGGYGVALVKDTIPTDGGAVTFRTLGMGLMYGAGWVFRERHRVSVAPVGGTYVTTVGDVRTLEGTAENVVINSWFAGVVLMVR